MIRKWDRKEERTPKYWWSHSPSLPRTETQCLQCEENWICALAFSPKICFTLVLAFPFMNKSHSPPRVKWSTRYSASSLASAIRFAVILPDLPLGKVDRVKVKVQEEKQAGEFEKSAVFLHFINFFLYLRQTRSLHIQSSGGGDCRCHGCEQIPFNDKFFFCFYSEQAHWKTRVIKWRFTRKCTCISVRKDTCKHVS